MTESKFTKGPWEVEVVAINPLGLGLVNEYHIVAQRPGANENFGDVIATVHAVDELDGDKANAYLLASSWELYAVAKALESWWRKSNDRRTIEAIEPVITMALEAIQKAEGRS
jgi:hypothetical protein